ncbi:hypothetical protein [Porphyromonas macacae]|uniref:hypothetical protein n=1 Tax=Porphyromonas macacae TaxID=28115 RepID=UPI001378D666|nr:hypothetical protein [Porphyromonas macacae]
MNRRDSNTPRSMHIQNFYSFNILPESKSFEMKIEYRIILVPFKERRNFACNEFIRNGKVRRMNVFSILQYFIAG